MVDNHDFVFLLFVGTDRQEIVTFGVELQEVDVGIELYLYSQTFAVLFRLGLG